MQLIDPPSMIIGLLILFKKPEVKKCTYKMYYTVNRPIIREVAPREIIRRPETIKEYTKRRTTEEFGGGYEYIKFIIEREGNWNPIAQNPHSTAFGLAQFLDSTWKGTGIKKTTNAKLQVEAMIRYIRNRYHTPYQAYQFKKVHGWY